MKFTRELVLGASALALASGMTANAQEEAAEDTRTMEAVTVTGSFIQGTPEDAALPVDVVDRSELDAIGAPTVNEILRNFPATQGLIGETNQFDTRGGQGSEGATTVNLRGLGSARTLVLLNGQRHVATGGAGTDVNFIPGPAIGRLEVLKDGAAALYGSDAIGGVVNFITRSGFEGVELRGSHKFISGSDGETEIGGIAGWAGDGMDAMLSAEYSTRGELTVPDRDWAVPSLAENPQAGFSGIGNPGTIYPAFAPSFPAGLLGGARVDPQCGLLGGIEDGTTCRFQYTTFDNLIEETESLKVFGEFNADLGEFAKFHVEAAFAEVDIPEWNTSPSYPPQSLFGPDRYIAASHPGLQDLVAQNPGLFTQAGPFPPTAQGAFVVSRMAGVGGLNGEPEKGVRNTEQTRLAAGLKGEFGNGIGWQANVSYSKRDRHQETDDMYVERMALALDGFGGAGCDASAGVAGVGPCEYYNPFSNAIQTSAVNGAVNPQYNAAVANSPELLNWLVDTLTTDVSNELLTFDVVFNGEAGITLGGGNIGWAAGLQRRTESYENSISDNANFDINPCTFYDPASVTLGHTTAVGNASCDSPVGQFAFLAGAYEYELERDIDSAFVELALPFSDVFDVQLAVRYEDYGGNVGSTVDPKIAAKWQVSDNLAFRGSASTTFRGPPQTALQGRVTSLQYLAATRAFKAVDTVGNPDLDPETALATNLGVLFDNNSFRASLDYWRFDFSDPLQTESAGQIIAAYDANLCSTTGAGTPDCDALASHLTFQSGTTASSGIARVERAVINGADIVTSGLDFYGAYRYDLGKGEMTLGLEGTYTLEYESEDFVDSNGVKLADGGDFVGFMNEGTPFQTLIDLRANAFARYTEGPHSLSYTLRYINDYEDVIAPIASLERIDSQITHDITYNYALRDGDTRLTLSAYNLTNEDPPAAALDLNYDPYTHSAFGRMIKLGVVHKF